MKRIKEIDKYKQDFNSMNPQSIEVGKIKGIFSQYRRGNKYLINGEGNIEVDRNVKVDRDVKKELVKKGLMKVRIYKETLYNPLSEKRLLNDFIKIESEKQIIEFSNQYGSLGAQMLLNSEILTSTSSNSNEGFGDSVVLSDVEAILYHVKTLRFFMSGVGLLKSNCMTDFEGEPCYKTSQGKMIKFFMMTSGDMKSMSHYVPCEECNACGYSESFRKVTEELRQKNFTHKHAYYLPALYSYDLLTYGSKQANLLNHNYIVLDMIQRSINNNIKFMKYRFNYDRNGVLKPSLYCSCLLEYNWYVFGMSLSKNIKQCKTCGNWFVSNRKDAEYCPPISKRKYSKCHPSYINKLKNSD